MVTGYYPSKKYDEGGCMRQLPGALAYSTSSGDGSTPMVGDSSTEMSVSSVTCKAHSARWECSFCRKGGVPNLYILDVADELIRRVTR